MFDDALGQLLTETHNGTVVNRMEYDNYGNILRKNNQWYTYGDEVWKDKLTAIGEKTITYDAQGNPTSYLGHALTWEKGRQLKSFDGNTYTYNANGIRTSKTVNGVKHSYILDGTKILRETWDDKELFPLYDNEDTACGLLYRKLVCSEGLSFYVEESFFFLKNLQGDIIAITDQSGRVVAKYAYDAWGKCTIVEDTSERGIATINPYRYRGYYYDSEIGMYYLQSRYYDPVVGRFVNGDDLIYMGHPSEIISWHLFNYCENDPVIFGDENGYYRLNVIIPSKPRFNYKWIKSLGKAVKRVALRIISAAKTAKNIICGMVRRLKELVKTAIAKIKTNVKIVLKSVTEWLKSQTKNLRKWFKENVQITTYKGAPVLVLKELGRDAFSFGIIVIGKDEYDRCIKGKSETLEHEYGHIIQLLCVGLPTFLVMYALPSLACYWFGLPYDMYFSMPWEYTADKLGGANRADYSYMSNSDTLGWSYLIMSFCISYLLNRIL